MADLNSVTLAGRLTRDAELKYTNSGIAILNFALAVNTRKKSGDQWVDEANFFEVTVFGKAGEAISSYLLKGKPVAIEGSLKQDRWEQDGQAKSRISIIANNVMLLGTTATRDENSSLERSEKPTGAAPKKASASSKKDDFEDDIPF